MIAGSPAAKNVGEVASRLEALVRKAEFDAFGYYRVPGGFALVTRIESLDGDTGLPLQGQARWGEAVTRYPGFSFASIFATTRPKGTYRVFVFMLTDDPPMTQPMSSAEASQRWAMEGAPALPSQIKALPLGPYHALIAMVYEFEKVEGGKTKHFLPSRWALDQHLSSLGIALKPAP